MRNRLFLILSIIIMNVLMPNSTIADGEIVVHGLDSSRDTETVIPVVETAKTSYSQPINKPPLSNNYIIIAGRSLNIVPVSQTEINAGDHVNKYGEKLLYGHNSSTVFGNLKNLGIGSTFTITENGTTTTYKIAKTITFEKNNGLLQLNGDGSYMKSVANARSNGVNYDLALMTCAGTSYGNGDASHRLVLFANKI